MKLLLLAGLLAACPWVTQEQPNDAKQAPAEANPQNRNPQPTGTITIPAGTTVPVTLTNRIMTKKARRGDAVRVVTAFPVTVGTVLAIPAGTYLDGVIDKVQKARRSSPARVQMHFTRMIFANGYEVALTSATALARIDAGEGPLERNAAKSALAWRSGFMTPQFPPPPPSTPPAPQTGPSMGKAVGIGLGVSAALAVVGILFANHHGVDSEFEAGTQFDLIFQTQIPLQQDRIPASGDGLE